MAQILPRDLTGVPDGTVNPDAAIIVDDGSGVWKGTPAQLVASGFPIASQPESEAGVVNNKAMTPQRVSQAINALGVSKAVLESPVGGEMVGIDNGSTVQQVVNRQPLQVDAFYEEADGDYWENAFARAAVAAKVGRRSIACTPNAPYRFRYNADIWPEADGWVPPIIGNNATIILGEVVPTMGAQYAGFRYRGLKSGALSNPIRPRMRDLIIDAQFMDLGNGVRAIFMENGSEWEFINVQGRNYKVGMHIANYRYADGGALTGEPGVARNCDVVGYVLTGTSDPTWYPYHEAGDLATGMPGQIVPAGEEEAIACAQLDENGDSEITGNNIPKQAAITIFKNETAGGLTIPDTHLEADIVAAGFTKIGTSAVIPSNGTLQNAVVYMCYTTGGAKMANAVVPGVNNLVDGGYFTGGRYSCYVQGAKGPRFRNIDAGYAIRGLAFEWSVTGVEIETTVIRETLSSAVLLAYGSHDWNVNNTHAVMMTPRWIGEGLFNFQINCGGGRGQGNTTRTHDDVTAGQCHIHIATNSSDIKFGCDMTGDCLQGYVVIESAAAPSLESTVPEQHKGGTPGAASQDMSDIVISGSIKPVSSKAAGTGATMVAILQLPDPVYGEIGLSRIDVSNLKAGTSKVPVRYYKIYENDGLTLGVSDPAKRAKQVKDCLLENVEFPVETTVANAATRMILPRGWAHFRSVKNVTNLDDNVERIVPNVATPSLVFGKYWWDTGTTTLAGILGGQGVDSTEGYEGREIIVRGNNSRAWATVSATSGTKDGLRITGTPVTATNVQRMVLRYNRGVTSWIGGLT